MSAYWSWLLTVVGVTGFILAGRKVWWAWYVNLGCQALWAAYAVATHQWGFLVSAGVYTVVFGRNAAVWTRERKPLFTVGEAGPPVTLPPVDKNCPVCSPVTAQHSAASVPGTAGAVATALPRDARPTPWPGPASTTPLRSTRSGRRRHDRASELPIVRQP